MTFNYLALGGCPLNNPMSALEKRGVALSLHRKMGFRRAPFSLSVNGALQLMRFCAGELEIPTWVREFCYADPKHVPDARQQALMAQTDIVMMEMSSPIEYVYKGFVLNQNRFRELILSPLRSVDNEFRSAANKWINEGIQKQNEALRVKYSELLLDGLPERTEAEARFRDVVLNLRGRHVREDEIHEGLKTLIGLLPAPLVIVLHNYSYMPDGRPIVWPADFKDNCRNAAARLSIPAYDPMHIVQRHWGGDVLMEDRRHYSRSFDKYVADEYLTLARIYAPSIVFGEEFGRLAA